MLNPLVSGTEGCSSSPKGGPLVGLVGIEPTTPGIMIDDDSEGDEDHDLFDCADLEARDFFPPIRSS
jgi:hypothetical protein